MLHPVLLWKDEYGVERSHELQPGRTVLGRSASCDVVLSNPYVSRRHIEIAFENDALHVVDLSSRHGTFVAGRKISEHTLRDGETITLGTQLDITIQTSGATTSPAQEAVLRGEDMLELTQSMPGNRGRSEMEKLSMLLDFEYAWSQRFSAEGTLHQILNHALQISGAERALILRRQGEDFVYSLGLDAGDRVLAEIEFSRSQSVVRQVATTHQSVFMTEGIHGELAMQHSIVRMNLRAIACLPLLGVTAAANEVLGVLYLDSTHTMHALSGLDQRILTKLAAEAGNVLEKLSLLDEIEQRKTLERELALAHETQLNLLPRRLPRFPGFEIRAYCKPTRFVGGDLYDFVPLDQRLVAILADVSGKGVAASLLSASLQGALQMQLRSGRTLEGAVNAVNTYILERSDENQFVTLFLVALGTDGESQFISAGHNPCYLFRARTGVLETLSSRDLILGSFDFATYTAGYVAMEHGDLLLVYSDGLTEAMNPKQEMFGEERLQELMRQHAAGGAATFETHLFDALDEFTAGTPPYDDVTFILIERKR